jgi:hypothetical protein
MPGKATGTTEIQLTRKDVSGVAGVERDDLAPIRGRGKKEIAATGVDELCLGKRADIAPVDREDVRVFIEADTVHNRLDRLCSGSAR